MAGSKADVSRSGVSLLFGPGERPCVALLGEVLGRLQTTARLGYVAQGRDMAELLASGLSFDVTGLAVEGGVGNTPRQDSADGEFLEAMCIAPGASIAAGGTLAPVFRLQIALAAELALCLPVRRVHWHPAGTTIEPAMFSRKALAWLAGGAFPAAELIALHALHDGSIVSQGLAHFAGQELALQGTGSDRAASPTLAAAIIDRLVRDGAVRHGTRWTIAGETLWLDPSQRGNRLWIAREPEALRVSA